jgi:hypothetical protein
VYHADGCKSSPFERRSNGPSTTEGAPHPAARPYFVPALGRLALAGAETFMRKPAMRSRSRDMQSILRCRAPPPRPCQGWTARSAAPQPRRSLTKAAYGTGRDRSRARPCRGKRDSSSVGPRGVLGRVGSDNARWADRLEDLKRGSALALIGPFIRSAEDCRSMRREQSGATFAPLTPKR